MTARLAPAIVLVMSLCVGSPQQPSNAQTDSSQLFATATQLQRDGKFREAIPVLQQVIALLEARTPVDERELSGVLNFLGVTYFSAGLFADAATTLERALAIRDRLLTRNSNEAAVTLNNLANVIRAQGDLVRAERLLLEVVDVQKRLKGPDDPQVAIVENNLASLYEARGDFDRAEPMYTSAIGILEANGRQETVDLAKALNNLGLLRQNRGDLDGARPILERALGIRRKLLPPVHPDVARGIANLAANYQERGDLTRATTLYDEALDVFRSASVTDTPDIATISVNLGMIFLLQGDTARAEPLYLRGLDIRERVFGSMHADTAGALERLAVFYQATRRVPEALATIRRAADIIEYNLALTIQAGSEAQKIGYLQLLQDDTDIILSMQRDFGAENPEFTRLAVATVLHRKGRVLETLVNTAAQLRARLEPGDQAAFDELAQRRAELARLVWAGAAGRRADDVSRLRGEIDRLEATLAAKNADARIQLRPVSTQDISETLDAGSAVVEYVKYRPFDPKAIGRFNRFLAPRYAAFVTRKNEELSWVDLGPALDIESAASDWRKSLVARQNTTEALGRHLADLILMPVHAQIADASHLYVVPDDVLNLVPFSALRDAGGQYLLERTGVSYLTSSRDLLRFSTGPAARQRPLVIAAPGAPRRTNGTFADFAFAPLPGAAREGRAIAQLIPGTRLTTGTSATETFVKGVHGPSLIHFATHAFFVGPTRAGADRPTSEARRFTLIDRVAIDPAPLVRAAIVLASGPATASNDDGFLTALEAASLDLRGTKLVVLSACETALGEVRAGDGVYGFRRAFAIAGAEAQVLTLWRVDDDSTAVLVTDFYRGLRAGKGRETALREAQLKILRQSAWRHPYFWAAFVVTGETSPIKFDIPATKATTAPHGK